MLALAGEGRGGGAVEEMLDSQEARFEEGDGRESGSVEGVVHFRRHCALNYCGLRMRVTIECVCSVVCTARRFSEDRKSVV